MASIFQNATEDDDLYYKVTFQRVYKQGNEWKTTTSFSRDDLATLSGLAQITWSFILDREAEDQGEESPE